jgi:hypothetical protein
MSAMTPNDRILRIGKKLEKDGLKAFGTKTPTGHPAYFRACGLQIIPSEAEEIDTGKTCRLIITPLAGSLSALVTDLIKALKTGASGAQRTEALMEEMKTRTFKDAPRFGEWEVAAAKDIVSSALKIAERTFTVSLSEEQDDLSMMDPFTGEIHEHRQEHWRHAREILGRYAGRGKPKAVGPLRSGVSEINGPADRQLTWLEVRAHLGAVIGGYWIPVGNVTRLSGSIAQLELAKTLLRKGLKPDIALTIIANSGKSPKGKGR